MKCSHVRWPGECPATFVFAVAIDRWQNCACFAVVVAGLQTGALAAAYSKSTCIAVYGKSSRTTTSGTLNPGTLDAARTFLDDDEGP